MEFILQSVGWGTSLLLTSPACAGCSSDVQLFRRQAPSPRMRRMRPEHPGWGSTHSPGLQCLTQSGLPGASLGVQRLRFCAPTAGGPGSIPGQETRPCRPQLKVPHTADKTWHGQRKTNKNQKSAASPQSLDENRTLAPRCVQVQGQNLHLLTGASLTAPRLLQRWTAASLQLVPDYPGTAGAVHALF